MLRWFRIKLISISNGIVNKAYREWSLKVHPDRVSADKKEEAGEKFKLITKIKNILSNEHSKSIYDRTGVLIDFDRNDSSNSYVSAQLMEQVAESYKGINANIFIELTGY